MELVDHHTTIDTITKQLSLNITRYFANSPTSVSPDKISAQPSKTSTQPGKTSVPLEAKRLFHGRGGYFLAASFINIDFYPPVILMVTYRETPPSIIQSLSHYLQENLKEQIKGIVLQKRYLKPVQNEVILGTIPKESFLWEDGSKYYLNFGDNQNIGFFLDTRVARKYVKEISSGKNVLNLFAYTCSFSIAALSGGANFVYNIDKKRSFLRIGQKNHSLNSIAPYKAHFISGDVFNCIKKIKSKGPFDLIIIDPPTNQKGSFNVIKDYPRLIKKLVPLLSPNTNIIACLNAPFLNNEFLLSLFEKELPDYYPIKQLPSPEDFPNLNEEQGLKVIHFKAHSLVNQS